jgi:predicted lipoprotein with Yx(FWY)xxD motif
MHTSSQPVVERPRLRGHSTLVLVALTAIVALAVVLARPGVGSSADVKGTLVTTAQNSLGRILVSSRGRTLYLFENDKPGMSACTGGCAAYWPPLLTTGKPIATAGVKAGLLGRTRRSDGTVQVTYAGHPLYTFALDAKAGQTKGEGLNSSGGEWYVLATTGVKLEKPSAPAGYGGAGY